MGNLNDLFAYADIDEVSEDAESGHVVIEFWLRETRDQHVVYGSDLDAALEEAREVIQHELTLSDLRREGLTDDDIARLAQDRVEPGEVWNRGYNAGVNDAAMHSTPAQPAFAEPFSIDTTTIMDQHPLIYVVYRPIAIFQERTGQKSGE